MISGRGTNLAALIRARDAGELPVALSGVISNRPEAPGLALAADAHIPTRIVDHRDFPDRASHDAAVAAALDDFAPELIVMAGYLRILTDEFVRRYLGRLINLHPSLLPRYPGLGTHQAVLDHGDREHGASVHFVTPELDAGPVIAAVRMPVRADDDAHSLARRLLPLEHRLLVRTVELFTRRRVEYRDDAVYIDGQRLSEPLQLGDDADALAMD